MSKIANKPIKVAQGVDVRVEGDRVIVRGLRGELLVRLPSGIDVTGGKEGLEVLRKNNTKIAKSLQGTTSRILGNTIKGVSCGWAKTLELVGTGYRSRVEGKTLLLSVGFSHLVKVEPPEGILFEVSETKVTVSGIDRQLVGETAAKIRRIRPPDSYKGKGIRYEDELVKTKPGKTVGTTGAAGGV